MPNMGHACADPQKPGADDIRKQTIGFGSICQGAQGQGPCTIFGDATFT